MPTVNTGLIQTLEAGDCINVSVTGNKVVLGFDEDALQAQIGSSALRTINGISPKADGSFFIHGSECDSWGYVVDGAALGTGSQTPEQVAPAGSSGIWFTDLCPACTTCDTIYEIKQAVEMLDVWINMVKDVELYDQDQLDENKAALEALRIMDPLEHCIDHWRLITPEQGRQLLQQYITVAHMWNYAVVQNNASFKLEIAPEDTAGFVVQTKRSLPNCDGTWHIRCTVTVSYEGAVGDDGNPHEKQPLSVFVPEPQLTFKPFTLTEDVSGVPGGLTAKDAALNKKDAKATVYHSTDYTTKIIQTDEIVARVGGTYELSFKILPFINYVIYDAQGHVLSIRNGTIDISGTTVDGNVIYDKYVPDHTSWDRLINPSKADYLNAKTAPTGSAPLINRWSVYVAWEVVKYVPDSGEEEGDTLLFTPIATEDSENESQTVVDIDINLQDPPEGFGWGGGSQPSPAPVVPGNYFKYEETRIYTCTGARIPNSSAIISGSTVPVDIPETTASTAGTQA